MASRAVLVAGLLALALAGCDRAKGGQGQGFEMPPALVTAAAVAASTQPVTVDAIGRCVAFQVVSIQPQVSGAISDIHFTDGAEVQKGDVLFTIDARPYEAQLRLAEANVTISRAQLELARIEHERGETLVKSNAISRQEYDAKRNAVAVAQAQLQSAEASVAAARINVEFCTIHAPISGRAGHKLADVGNVVAPGGPSLLVIQRQDPIYADFTVSERDLAAVRKSLADRTLRVRIQAGGTVREAPVSFLDNAVQDATGTVELRAVLENSDRAFWPGQFVSVELVLRQQEGALVVPAGSVQVGQGGNFVWIVKADSTVELRPIEAGQRHGELIVVAKGVQAGEKVVTKGQMMLRPGASVRFADAAPPAGAPK